MKKMFLMQNFQGKKYYELLDFCQIKFNRIFFYERLDFPERVRNGNEIISKLKDDLKQLVFSDTYRTGEKINSPGNPMKQYEFFCTARSIQCLKVISNELFGWQQPDLFEDLSFEGDDGSYFYSLAHESIVYVNMSKKDYDNFETTFPGLLLTEDELIIKQRELEAILQDD